MEFVVRLLREIFVPKTYEAQFFCLFPFILILTLALGFLFFSAVGALITDTAVSFGKINFSP